MINQSTLLFHRNYQATAHISMNLEMALATALSSGETITVTTSGGSYTA